MSHDSNYDRSVLGQELSEGWRMHHACALSKIDIVVRIVDERRVIVHRSDLVELFGVTTCIEGGLG